MGTPASKLTTLAQFQMYAERVKSELEKYVKTSEVASLAATDEEVEELLNEVFSKEENATE